jgi:thiamine biosynthesis lipoprotein ApbE
MWVRDTVLVASGVHRNGPLDGAIDPRTGKPSPGGSWAVATHKQGAIADALATTLLVTGPDTSVVDQLGAWALLMTDDGWVEIGGRTASVQSWSVQEVSP